MESNDWRKPNSWQRRYWGDLVDNPEWRAKAFGGFDSGRAAYKLWTCQETLGAACPANNERNMTMPKQQYSLTVAREADQFETVLKTSGIDARLHDGFWDIWADDPGRAQRLVTHYKTKAAPGMTTIELPAELASEISALRAQLGDVPLAQWLRQARGGQANAGGAKLADDEKAAASFKAERSMGLDPNGLRFDSGTLVGAPPAPAPPAVTTTKAAAGDTIGQAARRTMPQLYEKGTKQR